MAPVQDGNARYEVCQSVYDLTGTEWRVEAIDYENEGVCYVAIFSGPLARERAEEYAAFKNGAR